MSGRGPLIAGQAAIVAVLIAIVYFTFLQPDDGTTPSGIDAGPPNARNLDSDKKDGGGGGNGGAGGNGGGGGGALAGTAAGTVAGGSLASAGGAPGGTTPSGDQYFDSLALLKQQLGITADLSSGKPLKRR
jgi:hypothetical protein